MSSRDRQEGPLVYLSGFEPFLTLRDNPTQAVALALDGAQMGPARVVSRVLPVTWMGASELLLEDLSTHRPAASLLLGVSGQSSTIRLERFAYNALRSDFEDNEGRKVPEGPIDRALPLDSRLSATLDPEPLLEALRSRSIPAELWDDPGRYICNRVYYEALSHGGAPTLFVHLPHTDCSDPSRRRWTVKRLTEACRVLLQSLVATL